MNNENFMGLGGFLWFSGVVEDRQDPLKTGRLRVRILGHHTENKNILPTADLPWALCVLPITASGISGIGTSATGLLEGSWVFGFFRDGTYRQEPIILGSLPGRPIQYGRPDKGFADPNIRPNKTLRDGEIVDKENDTDIPVSVYPRNINEPDVNRLAVNDPIKPHSSLAARNAARLTQIQGYNGVWDQPEINYAAVYPFNHVYESESGHLVEFDDTTDAERIHIRHRSGTSIEMAKNGDQITITKNNSYSITMADSKVYIKGNADITVDGNVNLRAVNDLNVLASNINMTASGNITMSASKIDLNP
jgi:hypothetical protein